MRPIHKRQILAALALAAFVSAWATYPLAASRRPSDPPPGFVWAKVYTPSLSVSARSTRPGEILLSATANVTHPAHDAILWHNVVVRRLDGNGGAEQIWAHSFDGVLPDGTHTMKTYTTAPKGKPVKVDLPEFRLPAEFPPGEYAVFVEVVEEAPEAGPQGITNPHHGMIGKTAMVTVK